MGSWCVPSRAALRPRCAVRVVPGQRTDTAWVWWQLWGKHDGAPAHPNQRHLLPGKPSAPQGNPSAALAMESGHRPLGTKPPARAPLLAGRSQRRGESSGGGLARGYSAVGRGHMGLPGQGGRLSAGSQAPGSTPARSPGEPSSNGHTHSSEHLLGSRLLNIHRGQQARPRSTGCPARLQHLLRIN